MAASIKCKGRPLTPNKKAFDQGGAIWPPRSNAKDNCSGGPLTPGVLEGFATTHTPLKLKTDGPDFLKTKLNEKKTKPKYKNKKMINLRRPTFVTHIPNILSMDVWTLF